jgi:hypothetical protein
MVARKKLTLSPPTAERRSGRDRRQLDEGPLGGGRERRIGLEPRKPEVIELEVSVSEWLALNDGPGTGTGGR